MDFLIRLDPVQAAAEFSSFKGDDEGEQRAGDQVDQNSPLATAAVVDEVRAQLARRDRILEDLELLDVRVAVSAALEQEMALELRKSASVRSAIVWRSASSSAGRTVVIEVESTRGCRRTTSGRSAGARTPGRSRGRA